MLELDLGGESQMQEGHGNVARLTMDSTMELNV
jgi:hypothetical protein